MSPMINFSHIRKIKIRKEEKAESKEKMHPAPMWSVFNEQKSESGGTGGQRNRSLWATVLTAGQTRHRAGEVPEQEGWRGAAGF